MTQRKITSSGIADNAIASHHISDGAVAAADIAAGAVSNTQGMVHGFVTDPSTGTLTWHTNVTSTVDANGVDIYDSIIIGTDDMTFNVDANGHLIMTIS